MSGIEKQGQPNDLWQFQNKEKQQDHNLGWIDFGWRMYEPQLGRTPTMDPHADFYYEISPYSFLANNPINTLDPTGMDTVKVNNVNWPNFNPSADVIELDAVTVTAKRPQYQSISFSTASRHAMIDFGFWTGMQEAGKLWLHLNGLYQYPSNEPITHYGGSAPIPGLGGSTKIADLTIKSLRGKSISWILKQKPKGWRKAPTRNNEGWVWLDENGIERLRFMRPNGKNATNSQWARQENGYFRWQNAKGEFLDIDGNVVPISHPDFQFKTHISFEGTWP